MTVNMSHATVTMVGAMARSRRRNRDAVQSKEAPVVGGPAAIKQLAAAVGREPTIVARLAFIRLLRDNLDAWEVQLIDAGRDEGLSWAILGAHLGVSGQAIQQRDRRR